MQQARRVRRLQGSQDVHRQGGDLRRRQRPLAQPLGERGTFDVLQDEPVAGRRFEEIVNAYDGGMVELGHRPRLAPEAPAQQAARHLSGRICLRATRHSSRSSQAA